jgi:hypothetical protein
MLNRAKKWIGHGDFERWCNAEFPKIHERTRRNWMRFAKRKHISDLSDYKNISAGYRATEILPAPKPKILGSGEVDIFVNFVNQIIRECGRIEAIVEGIDLQSLPDERRMEAKAAISKVKELEARL